MVRRIIYTVVVIVVLGASAYWQRYRIGWNMLWLVKPGEDFSVVRPAPDYSRVDAWAMRTNPDDASASVFYAHPTSYLKGDTWNQSIAAGQHDSFLLEKIMPKQLEPFEDYAIFAPHYRQAIIYGVQLKDSGPEALRLARGDLAAAFEQFLIDAPTEKIILLGHSQGSLHLSSLLASLADRPEVLDRIAVAYLIGWPVPMASMVSVIPLPACTRPDQQMCVISFNLRSEQTYYIPEIFEHAVTAGKAGEYSELGNEPLVCWDPITESSAVSGKCTDDGWLEISLPPQDQINFLMSKGWYHTIEISLLGKELKEDAANRVRR